MRMVRTPSGTVGLYGVIAYSVTQRTREIGIRLALGAEVRQVRAMVVRQGMLLAAGGVGLAIAGAFGLSRVAAGLLHGIAGADALHVLGQLNAAAVEHRGVQFAITPAAMLAPRRSVLSRVSRWVAVTSLLVGAAACTSSTSTVTSPTSARCQVELAASPATLDASGGTGQIAIRVNRECTWDARSESAWITLAASTSGQGEANLGYSAAANSQVTTRRGSVVVNDSRIDIAQAGAPCRFELSAASSSIAATGGALSVTVSAPATCVWTAVSQVDWLRIESAREGIGQGTVTLAVSANPGVTRQGTVVIAEQSYTVSQAAAAPAGCQLTVTPPAESFATSGGEGTLQVSASGANCTWSAMSNAAWISIIAEGGSGNGAVRYAVAANGGAARTGTISVAGAAVTVTQEGTATVGCEFTVSPGAATFAANGGDGTVQVTASGGSCAWTAVSNVPWISVTSSGGGGSGNLRYTVAANSGAARTGTLTVAGTTVTVTQPANPACQFTVSPQSDTFPTAGGDGAVRIDASAGSCAWTAASAVPWIAVASASGSGGANLRYTVAANTGAARTGTLTVAGTTVTVTQAAAPVCQLTVSPLSASFPTAGGDGTLRIDASAGNCAWTAASSVPWITLATGSGSGGANLPYTVAANTGAARTGTLTVAGASVTVSQAATPPAELIELRGELSGLAGQCPNLTFTLQGTLVLTNAQTVFDERCDRIRNRRNYIVSGLVQADGRVLAVRVREE